MNRFLIGTILFFFVLLGFLQTVALADDAVIAQKKLAFTRLRESGLDADEAEKYSTYLQIALTETTQWEVMDYSVTASLISERGGSPKCANLQCAIVNGQLLNVDYICFGSIETIGPTFSITVQVADINSGRLVANVSKFFKGKEKVFVTKTIPSVAQQLATALVGKKNIGKHRKDRDDNSFETMVDKQATNAFGDVRGYLAYGSADSAAIVEDAGSKLAFGYLVTGKSMKPDDVLRYSYQLQSYLADVGACAMLYIDEMERLMKVRGGNLKCKDAKCAKNVGRLLGVDYMGYGKIFRFFGYYFVRTYIIDVESGKTMIVHKNHYRGKEIIFLTETIPQIAYKLGEILEKKAVDKK